MQTQRACFPGNHRRQFRYTPRRLWVTIVGSPEEFARYRGFTAYVPMNTRLWMVVVALCCAAVRVEAADARQPAWLVSTRAAPQCGDVQGSADKIGYWRLDDNCCWQSHEAEQFHATDDCSVPTVVFIHGNRADADAAVEKAWYVYEVLRAEAGGRAFRFVIWSWPSDRQVRPGRRDARLKAVYSDAESYYRAEWLAAVKPEAPVCLIGHSFGPRIITGALQMLAGGEVAGRSLPEPLVIKAASPRRRIRAVFLATASDCDWFLPGHRDGLALSLVDRLLVTQNCHDPVLRSYGNLDGRGGTPAMGLVGPALAEGAEKVDVVDVTGEVKRRHDWRLYASACSVRSRLAWYAFLEGE